jgi:hypothetical protein
MVLRLGDLPAGFVRRGRGFVSNAQARRQGSVAKNYRLLGRVIGYDAAFTRAARRGLTEVESSASIYRTGAGAEESLQLSFAAVDRNPAFSGVGTQAALGDERRVYLTTADSGARKLDVYTVLWRDGSIYATLTGGGPAGTVDPEQVLALAAVQQARIRGAF